MKNAMKKLMSLVLVAMILVSALPFAASASGQITVVVKGGDEQVDTVIVTPDNGESANVGNIIKYHVDKSKVAGDVVKIWSTLQQTVLDESATVVVGDTLTIKYAAKAEPVVEDEPEEPTTTPEEPTTTPEEPTEAPAPVVEPIKIVVKNGSSDNVIWSGEKVPANGEYATVENLLNYCFNSDWTNVYTYDHGWSTAQQANVSLTGKIAAGDTLSVMLKEKKVEDTTPTTPPTTPPAAATGYSKLSGDVILEICMDKNQTPTKSPSIKSSIALDGKVTLDEVKSVVKQYFNSIDTDTGIVYDGLYVKQTYAGNVVEWVNDSKVSTVEGLYDAANNSKLVTIRVYISNAKLASSGNADPTNPKTGDTIMMPVAVMTVSACALAVAFYLNKKRAF